MESSKKKGPGRPPMLKGSTRAVVCLDAMSLKVAKKIGKGNVSAGIRKALEFASQNKDL